MAPPSDTAQLAALAEWVRAVAGATDGTMSLANVYSVLTAVYVSRAHLTPATPPTLRPSSPSGMRCARSSASSALLVHDSRSYADVLQADAEPLPANFEDERERLRLLRLVLGIVVKSDDNDAHIAAMQSLPYNEQVVMMQVVESVLTELDRPAAETPAPGPAAAELDALRRDAARHSDRAADFHEQLTSAEAHLDRLSSENKALTAELATVRAAVRERDALRDELDELRHLADQSKRQERALDKLRERAEMANELRRQVRELEQQNAELAGQAKDPSAPDTARVDQHRTERRVAELEDSCETLANERDALAARCKELELVRATHRAADDAPSGDSAADIAGSLAAVQAEITALRNNAESKEHEAQALLCRLEKKLSEKGSGKWAKDVRPVRGLLTESFRLSDRILQRLQDCWDRTNKVRYIYVVLTPSCYATRPSRHRRASRCLRSRYVTHRPADTARARCAPARTAPHGVCLSDAEPPHVPRVELGAGRRTPPGLQHVAHATARCARAPHATVVPRSDYVRKNALEAHRRGHKRLGSGFCARGCAEAHGTRGKVSWAFYKPVERRLA